LYPRRNFFCIAEPLAEERRWQYTDWMKGLFRPLPNSSYEVKSRCHRRRNNVTAYGVFRRTIQARARSQLASTRTDYVYEFTGGKISHMTKICIPV
jgi:hypothetical protein